MTVVLEMHTSEEVQWREEAEKHGLSLEEFTRQAVTEKLIAGLKHQRVPQSLDEIKPRRLPPPGRTAMQMVYRQLPADEPDEDIRRALEEMS